MNDPRTILILLAGVSCFLLVFSLWGVWMWWWVQRRAQRTRQLQQRMGVAEAEGAESRMLRLWHDGEPTATFVPVSSASGSLMDRLEEMRFQAGIEKPLRALLPGLLGGVALASLLALLVTGSLLAAGGAVVAVLLVVWVVVKHRINRRRELFDQQFVDALDLAARSLRAGHPLSATFYLLAEEIPAPMGNIFAEICQQEELGVNTEEAVRRGAEQARSEDMQLFATALAIQLRSGGNLADMMERLAFVVRDRIRLNRRVQVLTAQTQLSKNVLVAFPFVMFLILNFMNPDYMATLYDTWAGQQLMVLAGIMLLFGVWVMNRLAVLRY